MSVESIGQDFFEGIVGVLSEMGYVRDYARDTEESSVWTWHGRDRRVVLEVDEKTAEFVINITNPTDGDNTLRKRVVNGNKVVFELDPRPSVVTSDENVFLRDLRQQLGLRVHYHALYKNARKSAVFFTKTVPLNHNNSRIVTGLQEDLARSVSSLHSAYYCEAGKKVVIFGN